MKNQEPVLFRWIKDNLLQYWKVVAIIPLVSGFLFSIYNLFEYGYFSVWVLLMTTLGLAPDLLVYSLFMKYLSASEENRATPTQRLSVEVSQGAPKGSVKEFFWAALIRWACCYALVWIFTFRYNSFFALSVLDCIVTVVSYSFALQATRLVQRHDSHDGASRLLGASVLFFCLLGLTRAVYSFLFGYGAIVNPLYVSLSLVMIVLVLIHEQRRYALAKSVYQIKDERHTIEAIDPLRPQQGLLPLAYWPDVNLDGILFEVTQSGSKDDPFRSNEVKVPLFIVPLQAEPFMGLLRRRLYGFFALLLVSVYFLFEYLA